MTTVSDFYHQQKPPTSLSQEVLTHSKTVIKIRSSVLRHPAHIMLTLDKKLSYRWQTARRVYRSVKVTKHGTIPYVRYGFLL